MNAAVKHFTVHSPDCARVKALRQSGVCALVVLVLSGCALTKERLDDAPASVSVPDAEACRAEISSLGTPSASAQAPNVEKESHIERRKHWLSVAIVATGLYFLTRALLQKDFSKRMRTPGAGPPSDPCEDPILNNRPPWCEWATPGAH